MPRIKIDLPSDFIFSTIIPIRITDLNYGNHVGNDTILSIIHEARMQYLASIGYTELQFAGIGIIMRDVAIEFKAELFYGDRVTAHVNPGEVSKAGFELFYKLEKDADGKKVFVAAASTGMVCFDYSRKKIMSLPEEARVKLDGMK
ncbi:MAG TPA: thioesterase family protein [Chitinophagaceae bacterium]